MCVPQIIAQKFDWWILCLIQGLLYIGTSWISWITPTHAIALNITEPFIDVELGSSLYLQCLGNYTLFWGFIDPMKKFSHHGAEKLKYIEPISLTKNDFGYKSVVRLDFDSYLDTGRYICFSNDSAGTERTSIYIFANDLSNLILPIEKSCFYYITINLWRKSEIPCHPTISKANVTLWKGSPEEELEYVPLSDDVRYDPTIGFTLQFPSTYFKEEFTCKASYEGKEGQLELIFEIVRNSQLPPRVSIDKSDAEYVLVNATFSVKCIVKVEHGTIFITQWEHPVIDENRVSSTSSHIEDNELYDTGFEGEINTLRITSAQKSDEGTYRCNVRDHSSRTKSAEVHIRIYENPQPTTVNLTTIINRHRPIIKDKGDQIELKVKYTSFPHAPDSFKWTKGKEEILPKIGKYSMKIIPSECVLTVSNLSRSDSGIYTLTAYASGGYSNISFDVQVKDVPIISLKSENQCCYRPGQDYKFICESEGIPLPKITWNWKPYEQESKLSIPNDWEIIDGGHVTNHASVSYGLTQGNNHEVFSILQVTAHVSGYYMCRSGNKLGYVQDQLPFVVTDIEDGLQLVLEDTIPLESKPFSLLCKASNIIFSKLFWEWTLVNENQSVTVLEKYLTRKNTSTTIELELKFQALEKENSGNYTCRAIERSNSSKSQEKSIELDVRELIEPYFISTNFNESKIILDSKSVLVLECIADGNPLPQITWYKNGEPFERKSFGGKFDEDSKKLVINRLVKEDSGIYECRAENTAGKASRNISVDIIAEALPALSIKEPHSQQIAITVVIGLISIALLILLVFIVRCLYKKKKAQKKLQDFHHKLFQEGQMAFYSPEDSLVDQAELLPYDERWEFPKERLKLGRTLGQGAFGRVVKAEAIGLNDSETSTTVAVKMLKERADVNQQKALLAELKILIHLGHHVNIVNLLGAVTKNISRGELMVMVEYCRYGNLRHYLLRHREKFIDQIDPKSGKLDFTIGCNNIEAKEVNVEKFSCETSPSSIASGSPIYAVDNPNYRQKVQSIVNSDPKVFCSSSNATGCSTSCSSGGGSGGVFRQYYRLDSHEHHVTTCDLLCYAFQCARGMDYLASRKLIHRDLAARNVLLAENKIVKICDFGLAKDCYKYSNYIKKGDGPLPIKWMSIESIGDKVFTTKSDVWSFGILMWEFFTLGGNPYPGVEVDEEFYRKLKNGYRMEKPEYCPNDAYDIMRDCWRADPKERPEFSQLAEVIGGLLEASVRQHYIDLNDPYLEMNQQMLSHDYLNVERSRNLESSPSYMNSINIACDINAYDNVPPVRSISDAPVPKDAMEAVPMIRLESISDDKIPKKESYLFRSQSENLPYTPDYLHMGTMADSTSKDEDSVFY